MLNSRDEGGFEKKRFSFGANWSRYLELVDKERIEAAEESLKNMLKIDCFSNKRFLDIGSGSGLFSLAARNLGANVCSFDYDLQSVQCTRALKENYWPEDKNWEIEQGDVLDKAYLSQLGQFDIVYSWGVLHHTGNMWKALDNIAPLVIEGGFLFIAIYNDQRWLSKYWKHIKSTYNASSLGKVLVLVTHSPYFLLRNSVKTLLIRSRYRNRGMDPWRDMIDWLGGYPFEVARPEAIHDFYRKRHFILESMTTVDARHGCNEFVFCRRDYKD